jgi:hypothetical protein
MPHNLDVDQDPLDLARQVGGGLLLLATAIALVAWLAGTGPQMLQLVSACWALYGVYCAFIDGLLAPLIEGAAGMLQSVGLTRAGGGYSDIETLVAQGNLDAAAEQYAVRASHGDTGALLRRSALLAGPLATPALAAHELERERERRHLSPDEDLRIGAALAHLYETPLGEPGRAMTELRRLIDRYPGSRNVRLLRRELAGLKESKFGVPSKEAQ